LRLRGFARGTYPWSFFFKISFTTESSQRGGVLFGNVTWHCVAAFRQHRQEAGTPAKARCLCGVQALEQGFGNSYLDYTPQDPAVYDP